MPGRIAVSFRREPSFFDAAVDGAFHQVIVCRDHQEKRIAGFGCRSVRLRYVNGRPTPVGYLSGLRALPEYRPLGLLARGYAFFRDLHRDGRAQVYLTTIAEDNARALSTLTTGRAGLPEYACAGRYHTVVIPIPRRRLGSTCRTGAVQVREARTLDRDALIEFLHEAGPARQFFPCLGQADFFESASTFRDLTPGDLLLAFRRGRLVGSLAGWDQHRFRQSVVESYDRLFGWARPFYNAWATIRGSPRLPRVRETLRCLMVAIPTVLDNDAGVFATLLEALRAAPPAVRPIICWLACTRPTRCCPWRNAWRSIPT